MSVDSDSRERALVVHALQNGVALCGKPGVPAQWEPGHLWVYAGEAALREEVTCDECRRCLHGDKR